MLRSMYNSILFLYSAGSDEDAVGVIFFGSANADGDAASCAGDPSCFVEAFAQLCH